MVTIRPALELHRRGQFDQAERLYLAILEENPRHFDALHLLGVLCHQQGRLGEASQFVREALSINSHSVEALANHGVILAALNRCRRGAEKLR
jgi:Flp pilus assembly protein TadD